MSKARKIRELLAKGLTVRQVAEAVGCSPDYVRVAGCQRHAALGGNSEADLAYRLANLEKVREWQRAYGRRRTERRHAALISAGYMMPVETAPPATRG